MSESYRENIVISPSYTDLEDYLINLPNTFFETGETIYKGRNIIKVFETKGYHLNAKFFKKPHLINQFAYSTVRESKAKRSYLYAQRLLELGINTPVPIAYMEFSKGLLLKYSLYISEHVEVNGEMKLLQRGTLAEHKPLLEAFAKFTAAMHEKNVYHIDYSPGNILFKKNEKGILDFYLVDLNRMEFGKPIEMEKAAFSLRRLWGSLDMIEYIAEEYAKARDFEVDKFVELTRTEWQNFWKAFVKRYPNKKSHIAD